MDSISPVKRGKYADTSFSSPNNRKCLIDPQHAADVKKIADDLFREYKEAEAITKHHGGWLQIVPQSRESIMEVVKMRRSLNGEANREFSALVDEFNRIAPGVQKETRNVACPQTADETYKKMKKFMQNKDNKIDNWEVAVVEDAGAHYSVFLFPKEKAIREGANPEYNSLPLFNESSKNRKEFPFGVVLESSQILARGPIPAPDNGSWSVYGFRDWREHGPCSSGRQKRLAIEKISDGTTETKFSAKKKPEVPHGL